LKLQLPNVIDGHPHDVLLVDGQPMRARICERWIKGRVECGLHYTRSSQASLPRLRIEPIAMTADSRVVWGTHGHSWASADDEIERSERIRS
jgi:hypothetical protein